MTKNEGMKLKQGDKIRTNARAAHWTRDLTFSVNQVKSWGVNCSVEGTEGNAYYRAPWDQIEDPQEMLTDTTAAPAYPD